MRINYLFSDISKEQGFNEIQREYLKKDIKNNKNIREKKSTRGIIIDGF